VTLTLLVRAYCHLCDEMRQALQPLAAQAGIAVAEVDVDTDAALEARWGDAVPVLLAGERELARYRLDGGALAGFLAGVARHGDFG
jgi:glutaredoxin